LRDFSRVGENISHFGRIQDFTVASVGAGATRDFRASAEQHAASVGAARDRRSPGPGTHALRGLGEGRTLHRFL